MEVHTHTHTARKKWTHYFWEFLMLFLAVFCGFLAENFREHYVEGLREKAYMRSMVEELKYDTAQCHDAIKKIVFVAPFLDSTYENAKQPERYNYVLLGKWNTPVNTVGFDYKPMMPTIEQLKSSGNLRLIHNREILHKILEYETFIRGYFQLAYDGVQKAKNKIYDLEDELCDYTLFNAYYLSKPKEFTTEIGEVFDMPINIKDPAKLNLLANSYVNFKVWNWSFMGSLQKAEKIATDLITLINSEYHLK